MRPCDHRRTSSRRRLEQQCRDWSLAKLNAALAKIGETAQAARLNSALESTLAEHLLMELGTLGETEEGVTRLPSTS